MKTKKLVLITIVLMIGIVSGIFLTQNNGLNNDFRKLEDINKHPTLGDKKAEFKKIYGDGTVIKYRLTTDENDRVYNINFSSFPTKITSIGEAMVFLDKFLPDDARLESFNGGLECPGIYDRCINERFILTYKSKTFQALTKSTTMGERDTFDVFFDFEIPEDNEDGRNLFYMKIE